MSAPDDTTVTSTVTQAAVVAFRDAFYDWALAAFAAELAPVEDRGRRCASAADARRTRDAATIALAAALLAPDADAVTPPQEEPHARP
jgi:hypothetical protein